MAEVARLDELIKENELDIERAEEATQGVPDAPSINWITEQVENLKKLLEQNTEQSALMVRKLFGKIVLEPCLSTDNKKYYKAHTKLTTEPHSRLAMSGARYQRKNNWRISKVELAG